jgi:hypothetical protein
VSLPWKKFFETTETRIFGDILFGKSKQKIILLISTRNTAMNSQLLLDIQRFTVGRNGYHRDESPEGE